MKVLARFNVVTGCTKGALNKKKKASLCANKSAYMS